MKNSGVNPNHTFKRLFLYAVFFFGFLFAWCGSVMASDEAQSHGEAHEATEAKGWVATDTYRVINFAVLAVGLIFILRKPVSQALNSRINGIKEQLSDLEEKKQSAEKELARYNEKLALLQNEAETIVEEYVRQGNEAKERILKEAEATAVKMEEKARRSIEHEFKQAKLQLQAEIMDKALTVAEKRIKEKITPDDQNKLVDEYLEKVVA